MGSVLSRNLVRLLAGLVSDQVIKHGTKDPENTVLFKCLLAGSAGAVGDARSKIGGGGKISDARFVGNAAVFHDENTFFLRDVLSAKGKGLDARQKLEKMRNLKVKTQTYQAQMLCKLSAVFSNVNF